MIAQRAACAVAAGGEQRCGVEARSRTVAFSSGASASVRSSVSAATPRHARRRRSCRHRTARKLRCSLALAHALAGARSMRSLIIAAPLLGVVADLGRRRQHVPVGRHGGQQLASGCRPRRSRRPAAAPRGRPARPCWAGARPAARWCRPAPGSSASSTSASVCTSSADSGSSSTSSLGLPSTARASASRWRCPPDSDRPCSPTRVVSPHGSSYTNSAWATASASAISASVASRLAKREVLPHAHREQRRPPRRPCRPLSAVSPAVVSRMSAPSSSDAAGVDVDQAGTRTARVVLPEPVAPTMASVSPGRISRSIPRRTGAGDPG